MEKELIKISLKKEIDDLLSIFIWKYNNTETRSEIKYKIEKILAYWKQKKLIYDFRVLADITNNTTYDIENKIINIDVYLQVTEEDELEVMTFSITPKDKKDVIIPKKEKAKPLMEQKIERLVSNDLKTFVDGRVPKPNDYDICEPIITEHTITQQLETIDREFTKILKEEFQLTDEQVNNITKETPNWRDGYEYAKKMKEFKDSTKRNVHIDIKNITEDGLMKLMETLASISCSYTTIDGSKNTPKCSEVDIHFSDAV